LFVRRPAVAVVITAAATVCAAAAAAQTVAWQGRMGATQALLVIDGQPQVLTVGQTLAGVQLLALEEARAEVLVGGQRRWLSLGAQPSRIGGSGAPVSSGREIILFAGRGGHFHGQARINGRLAPFVVDTGATTVAIPRNLAAQLGIVVKGAPNGLANTANGVVPYHTVTLSSLRIGDVELSGITADILPGDMGQILLGNSYLTRFQMLRVNDTLRLTLR
jgi:aspartyl protease family protein